MSDNEEELELRPPWSQRTTGRRVLKPLQDFLSEEFASAALLLAATIVALVWANSPWGDSYQALWHTEATIGVGRWAITMDLGDWVNDGIMTLFFFVVGLEIKRELTTGELTSPRAAALPAIAALGGMLAPAALFLLITAGGPEARGWGIPMATDIAFAVAVLTLAGRGLAGGLRSYMLTLAIVDDIGAIVVIALVYSGGIELGPALVAAGAFGLMLLAQRAHVRFLAVYVALGAVVWIATFESGLHATLAGVLLGFATPARPFQRPAAVSREAERIADQTDDEPATPDADAALWLRLANLSREAVSPLARLEDLLHPWSSYVVVPLFALANAGVVLTGGSLREAMGSVVVLAIIVGLVVGKTLGISLATWLAVRLGIADLPEGVAWRDIVAVAATAGIGFTVALFVSHLAFPRDPAPTIGILAASIIAGIVGSLLLRRAVRRRV